MQKYRIVELRNYDVLVPFVCQKCGSCCRGFAPQIYVNDLPAIAMHLGKSVKEIKRLHEEAYNGKYTDSSIDCSFLDDRTKCSIYPMRPEPCRLYPLETDFGAAGMNCGGHREFHRIVNAFFKRRKYAALWEPSTYKNIIRSIPECQRPVVWRTFTNAKPSKTMIRQFVKLNNMPGHFWIKTD